MNDTEAKDVKRHKKELQKLFKLAHWTVCVCMYVQAAYMTLCLCVADTLLLLSISLYYTRYFYYRKKIAFKPQKIVGVCMIQPAKHFVLM